MTQRPNAPTTPPPPNPATPGADAPVAVSTGALTAEDIIALRARRSELSNQLNSAAGRRSSLASELSRTADPGARAGLESRIAVLDKRMIQLESDIAQTGQVLSSDAAARVTITHAADGVFGMDTNDIARMGIAFMFLVMLPLAIGAARMMWKRAGRPIVPAIVGETADRIGRLERSVDAIAVEVERISEGQRFVTKLLSEKTPALPAQAERGEALKETVQFGRQTGG
jgi:hypothetical protein